MIREEELARDRETEQRKEKEEVKGLQPGTLPPSWLRPLSDPGLQETCKHEAVHFEGE